MGPSTHEGVNMGQSAPESAWTSGEGLECSWVPPTYPHPFLYDFMGRPARSDLLSAMAVVNHMYTV